MSILLYRPSLDVRSGAGQLIRMQAEGLAAAGETVRVGCERGALKFFLRTGCRARRYSRGAANALAASGVLLVDHGLALSSAHLVFVHNLYSEALDFLPRPEWAEAAAQETQFFAQLDRDTPIVANSELVKNALQRRFDLGAARIGVHYPGYDSERFRASRTLALRREARDALQLDQHAPLIGFVTSGDFQKRGLDVFLDTAERVSSARPDCRFLVVGSKQLPAVARQHDLVASGRVLHRPKTSQPELFMAALDLFVYTACFEEFGMVILEAQALGIPILTSRRVGASECLPPDYAAHLLETPEPGLLADKALALLTDTQTRVELAAAGLRNVVGYRRETYAAQSVAAIQAQKPRLK